MKTFVVTLFLLIYSSISWCSENDSEFRVTIPVNAEASVKSYMSVRAPDGFAATESLEPFYAGKNPKIDLFPVNERPRFYSKHISILAVLGAGKHAAEFMEVAEQGIRESHDEVKIVSKSSVKHKNYVENSLIATYSENQLRWLSYTQFYFGPKDLAAVLYVTAIEGMSEQDAVLKAKGILSQHVQILEIN